MATSNADASTPSAGEPRIVDLMPAFERFARAAFLEAPVLRDSLWKEHYVGAHPEVLRAYEQEVGEPAVAAVTRNLSHTRQVAGEGGEVMPRLLAEIEPAVAAVLDPPTDRRPLHVLMVGTYAANVLVTRLDDDVAVIHCLEWFAGEGPARVLIAHEDTHAWHHLALGGPPPEDLLSSAFAEALAIAVSREVVPGRPDADYFWYGVEGFEDWLPWCREHRDDLLAHFVERLDDETAVEDFFGAGFVDGHWRVGYFIASELADRLDAGPAELLRYSPDEAREAARAALV